MAICPRALAVLFGASLIILLTPGASRCQPLDYGAYQKLFGEPVTVGATGKPLRASESPSSITIITREQIAASPATDIPGVLKFLAGVDVKQHTRGQADVAIRGFNEPYSRRILLLINGRQAYIDTFSYIDWSSIPVQLDEIQQIEVIRGPSGALYGFNAASGVVNIVTVDPRLEKLGFANVRAGNDQERQASAGVTIPLGKQGGLRLTMGWEGADEFTSGFATYPFAGPPSDSHRHVRRFNSDLSLQFADDWYVRFEGSFADKQESELATTFARLEANRQVSSAKVDVVRELENGYVTGRLYTNYLDDSLFRNQVSVAKLEYLTQLSAAHTFRVSGEYRHNAIVQKSLAGVVPKFELSYDVFSASGMWEWRPRSDLTFTNAVRVDHLSLGADRNPPATSPYVRSDYDRDITEVSANSGVVWAFTETDSLRAAYGRGVQLPSLTDFGLSFGFSGFGLFLGGDPNINPSTLNSFELGYRRVEPHINGSLDATAFYVTANDVIGPPGQVPDRLTPVPSFLFANRGDSEAFGLELSANGKFRENWSWFANYTVMRVNDSLNIANQVDFPIEFESAQPSHSVNLMLGYADGPWSASAYGHFQSGIRELQRTAAGWTFDNIDAYFNVDARIAYRLNANFELALSGTNLLTSSQEQTSWGEVERRVLLSLGATF